MLPVILITLAPFLTLAALTETADYAASSSRIAFYSSKECNYDIYSINPDGTGLKQLTKHESDDQCPAWSPDGSRIAFIPPAPGSIRAHMVFPRFSPDGGKIAFFSVIMKPISAGLSMIDADGSNAVALTDITGRDEDPAWSPDGKELVFQAHDRDYNWNIYIINIGTGKVRPLYSESSREYWPHWSPAK